MLVEARCSCALEKCLEFKAHIAAAHARRVSSERELKLAADEREREQTVFCQQLASMAALEKEVASLTECKSTLKTDCEEKE